MLLTERGFAGVTVRRMVALMGSAAMIAVPAMAAQETGVSHPEQLNDAIVATQQPAPHYVKPSAGTPQLQVHAAAQVETANGVDTVYKPYVPLTPNGLATPGDRTAEVDPNDVNSGVVVDVPMRPNELRISTRLTGQLNADISTLATRAGAPFSASLTADVRQGGRVLLPQGTIVSGRVTQIHGGRRISGASAIRLQPETLTLPDGTVYHVNAEVVDLDHYNDSKVNAEGTIVSNGHGKATAAALGFTTGTAVIAGAMLGGGVGAVVGLGVGGGLSAVWWLKQDRQQTLPLGTQIIFALNEPLYVGPAAAVR